MEREKEMKIWKLRHFRGKLKNGLEMIGNADELENNRKSRKRNRELNLTISEVKRFKTTDQSKPE